MVLKIGDFEALDSNGLENLIEGTMTIFDILKKERPEDPKVFKKYGKYNESILQRFGTLYYLWDRQGNERLLAHLKKTNSIMLAKLIELAQEYEEFGVKKYNDFGDCLNKAEQEKLRPGQPQEISLLSNKLTDEEAGELDQKISSMPEDEVAKYYDEGDATIDRDIFGESLEDKYESFIVALYEGLETIPEDNREREATEDYIQGLENQGTLATMFGSNVARVEDIQDLLKLLKDLEAFKSVQIIQRYMQNTED